MVAEESHPFYQRCMNWNMANEAIFEAGSIYAGTLGIKKEDFALGGSDFYVKNTPEYKDKFKGKYSVSGDFLRFKKNNKFGKGWSLEVPIKPCIAFDHTAIHGRFSVKQFITQGKLYASVKANGAFKKPEGFTEIKASEFYSVIEKVNAEKLDYINI